MSTFWLFLNVPLWLTFRVGSWELGVGSWELGDGETGRRGDEEMGRRAIVLLPFTFYPLPFPFPLKPKA